MKTLGLIAAVLCLMSATAAHAQYNLNIDMHGERGTYGEVEATFFDVQSDGSGEPSGVYFLISPYHDPVGSSEFTPAADFAVSYLFGQGSTAGQIIDYSYVNQSNGDMFSLSYDQDPDSPYYQEATFTAKIQGKSFFAYPQEEVTEGGFVNYSVSSAPEPEIWACLLCGVALAGSTLRRRRSAAVPSPA